MWHALQAGDPDHAVSIAQDVHPERHPFLFGQAQYWVHYGEALARLRGRADDAVRALRTAEDIFPTKVRRIRGSVRCSPRCCRARAGTR
ncbi:MAG: hypothetical protein ACRDSL_15305 [Pseudonocardiaceae bacterium]